MMEKKLRLSSNRIRYKFQLDGYNFQFENQDAMICFLETVEHGLIKLTEGGFYLVRDARNKWHVI